LRLVIIASTLAICDEGYKPAIFIKTMINARKISVSRFCRFPPLIHRNPLQ
jgi:hypothetical protein